MVRFWLRAEVFEFGLLPLDVIGQPNYEILLKLARKICIKQQTKATVLPEVR